MVSLYVQYKLYLIPASIAKVSRQIWWQYRRTAYRGCLQVTSDVGRDLLLKYHILTIVSVIFAHGNAATRAMQGRVATVNQLSTKLDANVIAVSIQSCTIKHLSPLVWLSWYVCFISKFKLLTPVKVSVILRDYLRKMASLWMHRPHTIMLLVGALYQKTLFSLASHSAQVLWAISRRSSLIKVNIRLYVWIIPEINAGVQVRAVVLAAPFSSISKLLETYKIGGLFPLFSPMRSLPQIRGRFPTLRQFMII